PTSPLFPYTALFRSGEGGGHLGAEVQAMVRAAGLQQQHADGRVLGQTGGQHVAGRAGADDDVVEFHGDCLPRDGEVIACSAVGRTALFCPPLAPDRGRAWRTRTLSAPHPRTWLKPLLRFARGSV